MDQPARLPRGLEQVRTLGAGGFGYVVHARDPNLGRDVAVKFVIGGGQTTDAVARMLREGQALARLRHPAIVHVYEAVRVGQDVALLMEYVEGGDLTGRLNRPDFGVAERLSVLDQVAAGLAQSHAAGIVHRDLKPANILIRETSTGVQAKIADFGLARLGRDAAAFRTEQGVAAYTPGYGAPEQMVDPDHETPMVDWYSFAVVAFRLLRGTMPTMDQRGSGPADGVFAAALALDPRERLSPELLVARLREHPVDQWTPVLGRGFGDAPPMPEEVTAPEGGASAPNDDAATGALAAEAATGALAGGEVHHPPALPDASPTTVKAPSSGPPPTIGHPASAPSVSSTTDVWVDVPVYQPPPHRLRDRRRVRMVIGMLAGLVIGAAAGALIVLMR